MKLTDKQISKLEQGIHVCYDDLLKLSFCPEFMEEHGNRENLYLRAVSTDNEVDFFMLEELDTAGELVDTVCCPDWEEIDTDSMLEDLIEHKYI